MKAMKTKNMFWAVLSMTAALVMTACSSDNDLTETPAAPQAQKTIPYTVTVTEDAATTRATVKDDPTDRQLYFAEGDKLYITGDNIQGVLDIQSGVGENTGATFSGELTYSGSGSPADGLSLTATLVSAQQTEGTQVSVDAAGAVTVNYPTTAYCATINDAVQQYSRLTGTSTYSAKAFTLTQQTAFLNFEITFEDGTATGTTLSAAVSNNSATVCTADVTTVTDDGVKAKFVLPVAVGTTLSSATVTMGDKEAISFGASQTLTGKVYNVKKTLAVAGAKAVSEATAEDLGKVIGADGNIYADAAEATAAGTTAVALIAYVGAAGSADASSDTYKGLALALTDAGTDAYWCGQTSATCLGTQYNDYTLAVNEMAGIANTNALVSTSPHSHAYSYPYYGDNAATLARNYKSGTHPTGTSDWFLPSLGQWYKMITATSGYENLRTNASLQSDNYWSSTEHSAGKAWGFMFSSGYLLNKDKFSPASGCYVRSALAF